MDVRRDSSFVSGHPFSATAKENHRSGLGLAICAGLIDIMGGHLDIQSEANSGTAISFTLPMEPGRRLTSKVDYREESDGIGKDEFRVLVVDDDEISRVSVGRHLQSLGVNFELAACGDEAVDLMSTTAFDICIMDCQMPVMDGFEATQQIRKKIPSYRQPYIIAVSADDSVKRNAWKWGWMILSINL